MAKDRSFGKMVNKDTGEVLVDFRCAASDGSPLSVLLNVITQQIEQVTKSASSQGGMFGGRFGYGADFENDVFMMHPFCWCEKESCLWCRSCECTHRYFLDGVEITQDQYRDWIGESPSYKAHGYKAHWDRVRSERREPFCEACQSGRDREPHFRHKPSGFTVRWYKYIGRDMECQGGDDLTLQDLAESVFASLNTTVDKAISEFETAQQKADEEAKAAVKFWFSDEGMAIMRDMEKKGVIKTFSGTFGDMKQVKVFGDE